jgi:hypothetical protein
MKISTVFVVALNVAFVIAGGPVESVPPGNCPNCATGQIDPKRNTFDEYRQFNLDVLNNAPTDGICSGNRVKRIFNGQLGIPPVKDVCCCEPTSGPFYKVWPPFGGIPE